MKIFVPGRICLFGEHSDWAGGYRRVNAALEKGFTIICGTNQGIHAEVEPHPTALVLTATTPDGETRGPHEIPFEGKALLQEAQGGGFFSYAAGVAYQVLTNYRVRGLVIRNFKTDLPIKKGLSSSAAISVLTARAFNRVYDLRRLLFSANVEIPLAALALAALSWSVRPTRKGFGDVVALGVIGQQGHRGSGLLTRIKAVRSCGSLPF